MGQVVRVVVGTAVAACLGLGAGGAVFGLNWLRKHPNAARELAGTSAHAADATRPPRPADDAGSPVAGQSAAGAKAAPPAPKATPASPSTGVVGPDGLPARFALGINEAIAVPGKIQGKIPQPALVAHLAKDAERTLSLGARMVRGNTGAFPRSSWHSHTTETTARDDTDTWVRAVQAASLEPVLMISPWPGNRTANHTLRYVPDDMAAYTTWVTALVERYDHDGVADMPGLLAPIRYFEVDNEPDLKFTTQPKDAVRKVEPGSFCKPHEAAEVLLATAKAIRAASPDAKVLNGGIYRPHAENGQSFLRELFAVPGVAEAVDIVSIHSYASDEEFAKYTEGLAQTRKITGGKPIFVTETSVADEGDKSWMTAEWQARYVVVAAAKAAAVGARAIFWHTLGDPPPESKLKSGFERHSLFAQPRDGVFEEKPAARVYRHLATQLAQDDLTGANDDGAGAVVLRSGATLVYQGNRKAPKGGIDLRDGNPIPPGNVAAAPAWLRP